MSNKTLMEAIKEDGMSGLVSGAVAVAGSAMVLGVPIGDSIPIMGKDINLGLVIGGSVALAVSTSKFLHDELIDKIPALHPVSNIAGRFAPPVVAGLSTYALFRFGVSSDTSLMNSVLLGSLSAVTGDYISETIVNKYI